MIRYRDFRPTGFDAKGLGLDDRQDWWVVPATRNRDSGPDAQSNFQAALNILGGEQEDRLEVHRFGHWANGWFEIILAHPDLEGRVRDIEKSLADYPLLDDEDHARRQQDEYDRAWNDFGRRDWVATLVERFELCDEDKEALEEADDDRLREFYEECAPQSFVCESSGVSLPIRRAAMRCTPERLAEFMSSDRLGGDGNG